MMAFLLFLIVFAITYNNGTARPMTDNSIQKQNGMSSDEPESLGGLLHLPQSLRRGFTITINGILNTTDTLFRVVLRGDEETKEDCTIMFDFENQYINISAMGASNQEPYVLKGQKAESFELRIRARSQDMVSVTLQVNNLGPSSSLLCDISNLSNIKYIEMQKGVARTNRFCYSNSV